MSDIIKIREWIDTDETEPEHGWDWPHPPICIESRVTGDLRAQILANVGRPATDTAEVRIVESEIEGGWSEFTVETDYELEVWLHEGRQSQKVWEATSWTGGGAMEKFLAWTTPAADHPTPTPSHATDAQAKEDT